MINANENSQNIVTVTLPKSIKKIDYGAFYYMDNLQSVTFNEGLQEIGDLAFSTNFQLESVSLPSTVTKIGDSAFFKGNLKKLFIPKGLTTIESFAFSWQEITSILLADPDAKYNIKDDAFSDCDQLVNLTIASSNITYADTYGDKHSPFRKDTALNLWLTDKVKTVPWPHGESVTVKRLTAANNFFFRNNWKSSELACLTSAGTKATSLTVPANVTAIDDFAFTCHSDHLKQITINGTKTNFNEYSFQGVPKNVNYFVASDDVKNKLVNLGISSNQIRVKTSLSPGKIAAIVTVVVILAIAGLGTGILIPMRKQHKVNLLNSKLTNRRIDSLAKSNALAFKKVIEVSGTLNKKVDQLSSGRTNNSMHNQPTNVPPRPPRPFPPQRTQQGF